MTTLVQTTPAVGYFRVSTAGQAGERHVSLEAQKSAFENYCRANHLEAVETFTDVASGRKNDRVEYQAMLAYVAKHGIPHVVVLFLDRFGRNPREILRRYWELEEAGTTVAATNEDLREELVLLIKAGIAGQESKRTSERVRLSIREAVLKRKYVSKVPFGYVKIRDESGFRIEQVPEEAAVVRLAYDLAVVQNMGFKNIANELNRSGCRTHGGSLFSAVAVRQILLNPAMSGTQVFGKRCMNPNGSGGRVDGKELIVNDGFYPAILDSEEWDMLQERLSIRREGSGHKGRTDVSPYLLSGILRCGHCQGAMSGKSSGARPDLPDYKYNYKYYICSRRVKARGFCDQQINHSMSGLEDAVLALLDQYTDREEARQFLNTQSEENATKAEVELDRLIARLDQLDQGFLSDVERVDRKAITEQEFFTLQQLRHEEQKNLEVRKTELELAVGEQREVDARVERIPDKIRSFLEDFPQMEVRQRKAVLQGIIKTALIYNDDRIVLDFR